MNKKILYNALENVFNRYYNSLVDESCYVDSPDSEGYRALYVRLDSVESAFDGLKDDLVKMLTEE